MRRILSQPLMTVHQRFVGALNLLKAFKGPWIAEIQIWMVSSHQPQICRAELIVSRVMSQLQSAVVIDSLTHGSE